MSVVDMTSGPGGHRGSPPQDLDRAKRLRGAVDQRPLQPADYLCEAVASAVAEALAAGELQADIRARGWALVYVGDGRCPDVPSEWALDAFDLMGSQLVDPPGLVDQLWREAWTAGHQAATATITEEPVGEDRG